MATAELAIQKSESIAIDDQEYQPGVLAGVEVSFEPDAELTSEEEAALKFLANKAAKRDLPARLIEVVAAWEADLFARGFQFLVPARGGGWIIPGDSTGYGPTMQMDLALLPTNIYSAHMQIIVASLTRSVPNVRFEAQDSSNDAQITAAQSAGNYIKVIERNNDLILIQTDAARYLYTEGRYVYWTRFERDGQRFGWEEDDEQDDIIPETEPAPDGAESAVSAENQREASETDESFSEEQEEANESQSEEESEELKDVLRNRTPRGQEVRTVHGKLESKIVPMSANSLDDAEVVQLEWEVDISTAKGMFPKIADKIKGGFGNDAEGAIARLARQNVKLGMQSTYVTSDSVADDCTIQRSWIKPAYFMHVSNQMVRNSLIKQFPDGVLLCLAGDVVAYARNESMRHALALCQAYSGDGQNRNALGTSLLPVQKRINNWLDLMNDYFVRGVPRLWMDNKVFNVDVLNQQTPIPGDRSPFKNTTGKPVTELIYEEPMPQPPQLLSDFVKMYATELAELLSGAYPALAGGDLGSNDTAKGITIQRDQALGRLGPTWHYMRNTEAESMRQGVRWGAKMRKGTINERIPGGETISLEVNDLDANIMCYPESDENFPESYPQKQQRLLGFMADTSKNPAFAEVLYNPGNLSFVLEMTGLASDIYIPQVLSWRKQLGELELLLKSKPNQNPQVVAGQELLEQLKSNPNVDPAMLVQAEQQLMQLEQAQPFVSSIPVDPDTEDSDTEAQCCFKWLNEPAGRSAKHNNPDGYKNVKLHFLEHLKEAQNKKSTPAMPAKPPSQSISFKDLPSPAEQAQMLAKVGIVASPATPTAPDATGAPPPAPTPALANSKT